MQDLEFTNNEKIEFIYDVFAGILAVIATLVVVLQFNKSTEPLQLKYLNTADTAVYIIFVIDFTVRLLLSKNKTRFVKNNIFDLIAIIPFDLFTSSPYGSVLKLLKVLAYFLRLIHNMRDLLYTNGFIYALGSTVIITILGSCAIYFFEKDTSPTIKSMGDAFWWSFVTVTTVGYGDISPTTPIGRIIACILMLSGIGFISMLTSTVSTYFIRRSDKKNTDISVKGECILDISSLNEEQRNQVIKFYEFIKNGDS